MVNRTNGEIIADVQAHLEELANKIKEKSKAIYTTEDIENLVSLFEDEVDEMQDFGWALYLANETKEEYMDRKGDY